jgi:DNA polymerase
MERLLTDIRQLLVRERDLFGEDMLAERTTSAGIAERTTSAGTAAAAVPAPGTGTRDTVHASVSTAAPDKDLALFDLPVSTAPVSSEPWARASSLASLNDLICTCLKCPLGRTRTRFVFGVGNPKATLMLVGEAPGADEDAQGEPFVGRAGQLLNKILEAIGFRREDVYICNILKCRPPNNRKPQADEVELCFPYLRKQIELVRPALILCLGLTAAENLLGTTESLGRLRGRTLRCEGIPVMVTYHPAALLRNPNWKRPTWEDVRAARALHDELVRNREAHG